MSVGTIAYPLQIIADGASEHTPISKFILYDTLARIGQAMICNGYAVVPTLWATGLVPTAFLVLFAVAAGPSVRTLYTLVRIIQNTLAGREKPWVALFAGAVPVVGTIAWAPHTTP